MDGGENGVYGGVYEAGVGEEWEWEVEIWEFDVVAVSDWVGVFEWVGGGEDCVGVVIC